MDNINIKIIKLVNGEELIAQILPSPSNMVVKFQDPVRIIVMPNKLDPKTPNIGFAPWAGFSDDKIFTLDKDHVLVIMSPFKEFISQYTSMFSGIITPSPGLIIPT